MPRKAQDVQNRAIKNIEKTADCWYWTGSISGTGYGQIGSRDKVLVAHRVVYETLVGQIPKGLHLDHLCRNKLCVNPQHLEPVSPKVNILRGVGLAAVNSRKVKCTKFGHPLSGVNLYVDPRGKRECRECRKVAQKKWRNNRG